MHRPGVRRTENRRREEIVQVKVDMVPSYYSESEFKMNMPVRVRVPLPGIQRKAKFFFQIDSNTDPSERLSEAASALEDNKTITSGFLFSPSEKVRTGTKLDVYWKESQPQLGLRPFVRYEVKPDPLRYYAEQQVYWRTDDGWIKNIPPDRRILCCRSFLRLAAPANSGSSRMPPSSGNGFSYRREIGVSAMSVEIVRHSIPIADRLPER